MKAYIITAITLLSVFFCFMAVAPKSTLELIIGICACAWLVLVTVCTLIKIKQKG